jgi:hypothetical protein
MTAYRYELPGDLLKVLLDEQQISLIADFARLHEQRISRALEARAKDIKDDELDQLWEYLALNDQKWYNRFAVRWNSDPTKWRAAFTLQNLDALILAQWF